MAMCGRRVRRMVLLCCGVLWGAVGMSRGWAAPLSDCPVAQLDARFVDRAGVPGTLLVLRNGGTQACQLSTLPEIAFEGGEGEPLDVDRRVPPPDRAGNALPRVVVLPGATVTAALSWEVRDRERVHHCITPLMAGVILKDGILRLGFGRQMCASGGTVLNLTQWPLTADER